MIKNPAKVPEQKISSVDLTTFNGGLFLGGAEVSPRNALVASSNIEIDRRGYIEPRRRLTKFLPDTLGTTYQKFPVTWNNILYFFTADAGQIVYCKKTDSSWTACGGTNTFTTNNGGMTKFLRVLDKLLILNGKNGDKLAQIDLATPGFPVTKYTAVNDPVVMPSTTASGGITGSGAFNIYYAYSYTGAIGETNLSPIKTQAINHSRDEWLNLTTPGLITLTRGESPPPGAQFWSVYIAIAATSGSIQATDMLLLVAKLDTSTSTFVDDGSLSINLGSVAPIANSTDGPRVENGITFEGNPLLFGDQDNPYAIWIGGGGVYALDFSISNGGYKAEPEKGTNYYPSSIVGFRSGSGVAALTVLYSNTEGLSKQAILAQETVTYGTSSFTVWGVKEQHYGAAGMASPNSAINYNGAMNFLSTDGFVSMDTAASRFNVLSITNISYLIEDLVKTIKVSAMDRVIGTGWGKKYMWIVPTNGFDTPQQILVYDVNNAGIADNSTTKALIQGAWYTLDIAANWIGTISPPDSDAFVYVSTGTGTYELTDFLTTADFINGFLVPFSTSATGAFVPVGDDAHNSWMSIVQGVYYLLGVVGQVTVGVNYRNLSGNIKTKTKVYNGPGASPSISGGWGDTQWMYANAPLIEGWGKFPLIDPSVIGVSPVDVRVQLLIDDIANEMQWFIITNSGYNNYKLKSVSFEGVELGIRPDLQ